MDPLRLQSAFKFVAISRFGDGGQLNYDRSQLMPSGGGPIHARVPIHAHP